LKTVLAISSQDPAASNILERLVENFCFKQVGDNIYTRGRIEIIVSEQSILFSDDLVNTVEADLIVVPSKHVSDSGRRSLLVHSTGNWGNSVAYGGLPESLSMTSAHAVYSAVHYLKTAAEEAGLDDVEVGVEATHHGPFSSKPLIFVEVGSSDESWRDVKMAEVASEAIVRLCINGFKSRPEPAVGFGGGHYARNFVKKILEGGWAVGHIASKHHFPLNESLIRQSFEKTVEKPKKALVDWDGLKSEHRRFLTGVLEEMGVEIVRV